MRYCYHLMNWPAIWRNQSRAPADITRMQEMKLAKLAAHAYEHVPYYRNLFNTAGLKPRSGMTLDDLKDIPVLTKDDIVRNYPHNMLADNAGGIGCSARMTSGSSGKKLEVVLDNNVAALYRLMQLRQLIDIGYRPWYTMAYVRFSPPVTSTWLQKIKLFRRFYIPLEWDPRRQVAEIMRRRPDVINAYPSVLFLLAKTIGQEDADSLGLKFIMSNSEVLSAHVRDFCEEKFQCKVFDDYSCLEFSAIASECRLQNLHIAADNVIVEVLDDAGNRLSPGAAGKLVLTSLNNYSMPYIRYEIGDVGAVSGDLCPCGSNFPVLTNIAGRCDDFIVLPSGELIDPQTIVFQVETLSAVKEFRIVQQEDKNITISIIPQNLSDFLGIAEEIKTRMCKLLGRSLHIKVIRVNSFDRGSTGKHRSVISYTNGDARIQSPHASLS
ncbi:MAG: phenylacetate--CoA ligase family protein [Syntrophorhabdaceae bacterium]